MGWTIICRHLLEACVAITSLLGANSGNIGHKRVHQLHHMLLLTSKELHRHQPPAASMVCPALARGDTQRQ